MKYRSEILFGEGYRKAAAVMAHEVFGLQNTDILRTLSDTILKNSPVREQLEILEEALQNDTIPDGDDGFLYQLIEDAYKNEEIGATFFEKVLAEIKSVTGKDIKYCLWLCDTKEEVYRYDLYNQLTDENIDAYEESDIILSNCGTDGSLYGYEQLPKPLEIEAELEKSEREQD